MASVSGAFELGKSPSPLARHRPAEIRSATFIVAPSGEDPDSIQNPDENAKPNDSRSSIAQDERDSPNHNSESAQ
jgi:hypothetical protein